MKRFGEQLHKKAQTIRLNAVERSDLRARIVSYMEYHPLPKTATSVASDARLVAEPYRVIRLNYTYLSSFVGALTMLMLVVIPVVAEKAVPGDVLYPVKVQFNEEVRSTLAWSPYAKVEWETERLERRLAEARLLADEGRLTEEIEAAVAQAVEMHSDAAKQEIAALRVIDNDEATIAEITFASALEVQSEVLESRNAGTKEAGRSVTSLASAIAEARSGVEATAHETVNVSYEKLLARLELETTHAQELFTSIQTSASPEEVVNITRRLDDIKRKINASVALYETAQTAETETDVISDEGQTEAKMLLRNALVDTRKLISFMTNIDVRTNVSIDTLVPVTLTDAELEILLLQRLDTLTSQRKMLATIEPFGEVTDKFEFGKAKLVEVLEAATAALEDGEYKKADKQLSEAEAIMADLLTMGAALESNSSSLQATRTEEVLPELASNRPTSSASSTEIQIESGQ